LKAWKDICTPKKDGVRNSKSAGYQLGSHAHGGLEDCRPALQLPP
jgi:hypothetical protein